MGDPRGLTWDNWLGGRWGAMGHGDMMDKGAHLEDAWRRGGSRVHHGASAGRGRYDAGQRDAR